MTDWLTPCPKCGKQMNPIEVMIGCGDCARRGHQEVLNEREDEPQGSTQDPQVRGR